MSENNKTSAEDKLKEINAALWDLIRFEAEMIAEKNKPESEKK